MLRCSFAAPSYVVVGCNELKQAGTFLKTLGKTTVFVVTDRTLRDVGVLEKVISMLSDDGIESEVFDGVEPEPKVTVVLECYKAFLKRPYEAIIGLGGGSSMDVAKTVSVMTGPYVDDITGVERIKERKYTLVLLPTTSGTGSEITKFAILTDDKTGQKIAIMSSRLVPDAAIVDPVLTVSMPDNVTAVTGMDALSHAIETYLSPRASLFTETLALEAIRFIGESLPKTILNAGDLEARSLMSYASTLGGLLLNSTDGGGPVHGIGYPLGVDYHLSHGLSNSLMLVNVLDFVAPSSLEKFGRIHEALKGTDKGAGIRERATEVGSLIKDLIERIGLPKTLKDVGVEKSDLKRLSEFAFEQQRLLKNSQREFALEDIKTIFKDAYQGTRTSW